MAPPGGCLALVTKGAEPADGRASIHELWSSVWAAPSPLFLAERSKGELAVARIRVFVLAWWFALHLASFATGAMRADDVMVLGCTGIGLAIAVVLLQMALRGGLGDALPFVSTIIDVTVVSATIVAVLSIHTVRGSFFAFAVFPSYLLVIVSTLLRHDRRVCVVGGLAAILEYEAVVFWAMRFLIPTSPAFAGFASSEFDGAMEVGTLAFLVMATLLAVKTVTRTEHLRLLSMRDSLTGLPNRAYLDDQLVREAARAARCGDPFTLVMLDIDHFKHFNDGHGHAAGDAALRTVAGVLKQAFRSTDLVARYGGEEFVALMLGTRFQKVRERLESVRREVAQAPVVLPRRCSPLHVTLSAGVAAYPEDGAEPWSVLATADRRLYEAKACGRNRIVGPATG